MQLTQRELEVLRFFAQGPVAVHRYKGQVPMKTVYRFKDKFIRLGLLRQVVDKDGTKQYGMTEEGLRALHPPGALEIFRTLYPPAASCPTRYHEATLVLIAAAAHARRFELGDEHHGGVVVLGPTLRWKSWLGTLACYMLGVDPDEATMLMSSESGRSLFTRRGFAGVIVSQRDALHLPIAVLDEFHRSDSTARRLAEVYLEGRLRVPSENQPVSVACVPVVLMNPLRDGDIEAKTGLTQAILRRCIVVDLGQVEIPAGVRETGVQLLEQSRGKSLPWKEPEVGPAALLKDVSKALDAALIPSARGLVDAEMIAKLVAGLTGHLDTDTALHVVLEAYLTTAETLGRTRGGWHGVLSKDVRESAAITPSAPAKGDLRWLVLQATSGVDSSFLEFLPKAEQIYDVCREIDVGPDEVIALVGALKKQGRKLKTRPAAIASGLPRTKEEVVQMERRAEAAERREQLAEKRNDTLVRTTRDFKSQVESLKMELGDLETLRALYEQLRSKGLTAKGALDAVELLAQIHAIGWTVQDAEIVAGELSAFPGGTKEATRRLQMRLAEEAKTSSQPQGVE